MATLTNQELSAASLTVEEATSDIAFLVEDAVGPVYAPYNFRNQAVNTGTTTNQAANTGTLTNQAVN